MYFEKRFVAEDAGVDVDDVKDLDNGSAKMRAYLLVLDHPTKSVVLGIRGTYSLADTMVDLVLDPTGTLGSVGSPDRACCVLSSVRRPCSCVSVACDGGCGGVSNDGVRYNVMIVIDRMGKSRREPLQYSRGSEITTNLPIANGV